MKRISALFVCAALAFGIIGCSSGSGKDQDVISEDTTETTGEQTSITETEATTFSETTIVSETTTVSETTEDPRPWYERTDINFEKSGLELSIYMMKNLESVGGENIGRDVFYYFSEPEIEASDPDEDGYVTYHIRYTADSFYSITIPYETHEMSTLWMEQPESYWFLNSSAYKLVDSYTGTLLCCNQAFKYTEEQLPVSFEYNGEEITVYSSYYLSFHAYCDGIHEVDEDNWGWDTSTTMQYEITFRAPQDYDGLYLYIDTNGYTMEVYEQYLAGYYGPTEGEILEIDEVGDSYVFMKARDLIVE